MQWLHINHNFNYFTLSNFLLKSVTFEEFSNVQISIELMFFNFWNFQHFSETVLYSQLSRHWKFSMIVWRNPGCSYKFTFKCKSANMTVFKPRRCSDFTVFESLFCTLTKTELQPLSFFICLHCIFLPLKYLLKQENLYRRTGTFTDITEFNGI